MTLAVIDECSLDLRPRRTLDFFRALEQVDGTFGPSPLLNGIAASALLRVGEQLRDPQAVADLILRSQSPAGGFADARPGAGRRGPLDQLLRHAGPRPARNLPDLPRLAEWVGGLQVAGGGFGPGGTLSANATYQCLSILDWLAAPALDAARRGEIGRLEQYLDGGGDPDIQRPAGLDPAGRGCCPRPRSGRSFPARRWPRRQSRGPGPAHSGSGCPADLLGGPVR